MVLQRALEKKEPLRKVADDDGVSHETIRCLVRAARRSYESRLRTDHPRSQHKQHHRKQAGADQGRACSRTDLTEERPDLHCGRVPCNMAAITRVSRL